MSISRLIQCVSRYVRPRALDEDVARREFILNVFVLGVVALLFAGAVVDAVHFFLADPDAYRENSLPSTALYMSIALLGGIYLLARRGQVVVAAYVLVGALLLLTAYMGYVWGVDVPAQIVLYPLVIIMAGVLIRTRTAFVLTLLIVAVMVTTGVLHRTGILEVNHYWKTQAWTWSDIAMIAIIYILVAIAAWLSNREIERSLARARHSEQALLEERDLLEVRVRERTDDVARLQMERMAETYRLVEFGRFAGGIFHDLISPLTALSLTMRHLAETSGRPIATEDVSRAERAIAHMYERLDAMRTHLARGGDRGEFSVIDATRDVQEVLTPYARERGVRIVLDAPEDVLLLGDRVAYTQVLTNLVSNAIQAYGESDGTARDVRVVITSSVSGVTITVTDAGLGIAPEDILNIFEPFFTTKPSSEGLGIGLSLVKRIIEKEFDGTITVHSMPGKGTTFTVYLPVREP